MYTAAMLTLVLWASNTQAETKGLSEKQLQMIEQYSCWKKPGKEQLDCYDSLYTDPDFEDTPHAISWRKARKLPKNTDKAPGYVEPGKSPQEKDDEPDLVPADAKQPGPNNDGSSKAKSPAPQAKTDATPAKTDAEVDRELLEEEYRKTLALIRPRTPMVAPTGPKLREQLGKLGCPVAQVWDMAQKRAAANPGSNVEGILKGECYNKMAEANSQYTNKQYDDFLKDLKNCQMTKAQAMDLSGYYKNLAGPMYWRTLEKKDELVADCKQESEATTYYDGLKDCPKASSQVKELLISRDYKKPDWKDVKENYSALCSSEQEEVVDGSRGLQADEDDDADGGAPSQSADAGTKKK